MEDDRPSRVCLHDPRDRLLDDGSPHRGPGAAATAPTSVLREGTSGEGDHRCSYCHPQEWEKGVARKVQLLRDYGLQDEIASYVYADIIDYRVSCRCSDHRPPDLLLNGWRSPQDLQWIDALTRGPSRQEKGPPWGSSPRPRPPLSEP